ncbi:hypothetical protein H2200_003184 [Cladophialophora chaetospira]|uniref:Uncharacterized protein n=1 Tax=Cladophialophora chaetospira TaxID=386627 RepID=A0AA38XH07_9EURO|nr:hypothetical protein H2200_003184 [Cladophialophora chaetospira]
MAKQSSQKSSTIRQAQPLLGPFPFEHVEGPRPRIQSDRTQRRPVPTAVIRRELQMRMAATAICLSILAVFIVITIVVYFIDYKHFANLQRDVDSIADILRLVCDSPNLLVWLSRAQQIGLDRRAREFKKRKFPWFSKEKNAENHTLEGEDEPKVKLDMFMGSDGERKRIVEVVDPEAI